MNLHIVYTILLPFALLALAAPAPDSDAETPKPDLRSIPAEGELSTVGLISLAGYCGNGFYCIRPEYMACCLATCPPSCCPTGSTACNKDGKCSQ